MSLILCEVGPRDGLQTESAMLGPEARAELANRMMATGVPRVEVASFVNPARVPQMAGAEAVVANTVAVAGCARAALVLNRRGYERLRETDCERVHVAFCVTEEFNRRNQGCSVEQSVQQTIQIAESARADGRPVTVILAASFGCPFSGEVDPGRVTALAERVAVAGVDQISFADTIGVGVPWQVKKLLGNSRGLGLTLGLHLHNTRNTGYANAYAAIDAGVGVLDSSVGGIGGCPFAPRATGNIATEDLIYLLEKEGVSTGVDLDGVLGVAEWLAKVLDRPLPGLVYRAGPFPPP
ncbi:MAG TPA: hydroxymethylglutaryl-CoA lyase [Pseudonocardiaceae bacterium]|jgi:hydroxymethylglutaryl-CoA lyase/(R)-citramalyl-CoA lyase|nr:hydroxymethylglutaryl-CoA lyase [Pseudonocardiaceae bacterium]